MHQLAAAALLAVSRGTTVFAMKMSTPESVACQLEGATQPGAFVQVDGVLFERVLMSSEESSLLGHLRKDKGAFVVRAPDEPKRKPFRVYCTSPQPAPSELVNLGEEVSEHFDLSVALRHAARLSRG